MSKKKGRGSVDKHAKMTSSGKGMNKHRKSGKVHSLEHFSGKKSGKRTRRKGKSRKERKQRRGTHENKYKNK